MQYMAITPQGKEVDVINVSHFVDKQFTYMIMNM